MRNLIATLLLALSVTAVQAKALVSPNEKLSVQVKGKGMVVNYNRQAILEIPSVGYQNIGKKPKFSFVRTVADDYQMLAGKRLHCTNEAKEYQAPLGKNLRMVLRIYNDGIAFRYEFDNLSNDTIPEERTAFRITEGTKRWMQQWSDAYEGFFPLSTTAKVKPERGFSRPSLSADGFNIRWGYPLLMEPVDGVFALISEANIERRQSASCLYNDGELFRVVPDANELKVSGEWHTPWRVVIIGGLSDIVESTLITDVSKPSEISDMSWIHPGVVSWIYWAYNHGSNDFDIIKKYVDMAVTLRLPYVLIDAEWDEMKNGKTVEDAVSYARSQGVRPLIWYNSSIGWIDGAPGPKFRLNKPEDREKEFAWCERIGVAGVKIDFFSGDNQRNMDYCLDLLECAARHHLLVNFHGATIPRGWQRTWPNLLSTEGVYGAEWYNNVPTFTNKAARHNATLPFTRNVIGPMDYTPCTFSDSQHPHITSNGHELALTVLYESGLQHLADKPESYLTQPVEVQRFLSQLPAIWDETKFLGGYPGEWAAIARRRGNTWYVACINGSDEARTVTLPLSFIKGRQIQLFEDGNPWSISSPASIPTQFKCQPRGGFVMVAAPGAESRHFTVKQVAPNAVRIIYGDDSSCNDHPDWMYVENAEVPNSEISVEMDAEGNGLCVKDKSGRTVFKATSHELREGNVSGVLTNEATLTVQSPQDEFLFGLGQFQDGYANVRGLPRRLTQVNTQIAVPMLLSSKGYGVLWNNYGMTEFNPPSHHVNLVKRDGAGDREEVNVTTTEGGRREVRERHVFEAEIQVDQTGDYSLLLDVGQRMARRHNLCIDGTPVIEMQNLWLPPTASAVVHLTAGKHTLTAELTRDDKPVVYYGLFDGETVFRSPVAHAVDYTVFVGTPDEIIGTYRQLTGKAPLVPQWALGYIHCRERFHSSEEILETAKRFRQSHLPVDVMVQDWQYWGRYGWNAMRFDEQYYPNPKALTDSLHQMNMRLMLSVWSKIDKNSEVGKRMLAENHYILGTDWIDFFSADAANAYWSNFAQLLVPQGIDAWWQDATEPENDDLRGRWVNHDRWLGDEVRNVYPLLVNKTVYEGLLSSTSQRPFILTRSGFPGIQRYGAALWSGDVGNDWETFRRQITAGLGLQAAGIPWWTYDAGGFFRPGNQYTDKAYIQRMLRWIETSVYLPLIRVHGYMSNTEPWNYGDDAQKAIAASLEERYRLMPYIYSIASWVTNDGYTLMRPLVFDFSDDPEALKQKYEYMFGPSLLVSPVTQPDVSTWDTYLPKNDAGWYDFRTGKYYEGGQTVTTDARRIPVFVRGGSILPLCKDRQYALDQPDSPLEIQVYPGKDASFTLYQDDGVSNNYQNGQWSSAELQWDEKQRQLHVNEKSGNSNPPKKLKYSIKIIPR